MENEYPKQLYRSGWDDLEDTIVVLSPEEEMLMRDEGFKMLSEPEEVAAKRGRKPKEAI